MIGRGSSHKVFCDVTEVESLLVWEFVSSDYDISFEVSLLINGEKHEVVK